MKKIRKFRKNIRRVRHMKYAKLENNDKILKATMTFLRLAFWVSLILIALPLIATIYISLKVFGMFLDSVEESSTKSIDWQGRTYYHKPYFRR